MSKMCSACWLALLWLLSATEVIRALQSLLMEIFILVLPALMFESVSFDIKKLREINLNIPMTLTRSFIPEGPGVAAPALRLKKLPPLLLMPLTTKEGSDGRTKTNRERAVLFFRYFYPGIHLSSVDFRIFL